MDECLENRLICGREADCVNRPGSYVCRCHDEGARFDPATLTCVGGHGGHGTGLSVTGHTTSCSSNEQCVGNAVCSGGACLCPAPNLGPNCESKEDFALITILDCIVKVVQSKLDFTYFFVSGEKYVKSGCT